MISSAQRVEHYEIAAYGTLRTYADQLGLKDHARLLQQTLDEEGDTNKLLTKIAEQRVNRDAEVG
jgi:ferritin-like metal-binding protein YciE